MAYLRKGIQEVSDQNDIFDYQNEDRSTRIRQSVRLTTYPCMIIIILMLDKSSDKKFHLFLKESQKIFKQEAEKILQGIDIFDAETKQYFTGGFYEELFKKFPDPSPDEAPETGRMQEKLDQKDLNELQKLYIFDQALKSDSSEDEYISNESSQSQPHDSINQNDKSVEVQIMMPQSEIEQQGEIQQVSSMFCEYTNQTNKIEQASSKQSQQLLEANKLKFRQLLRKNEYRISQIIIFLSNINKIESNNAIFIQACEKLHISIMQYLSKAKPFRIQRYHECKSIEQQGKHYYFIHNNKGEKEYSLNRDDEHKYVQLIASSGKKGVLCWMVSLAQLILQFECLGLINNDIKFRNLAKMGNCYFGIDMDRVFAVQQSEEPSQQWNVANKKTYKVIQAWLQLRKNLNGILWDEQTIFVIIFTDLKQEKISQLQSYLQQQSEVTDQKRDHIMKMLKDRMQPYHRLQFKKLITKLLGYQIQGIDEQLKNRIQQISLNNLEQFIKQLNLINNEEKHLLKEEEHSYKHYLQFEQLGLKKKRISLQKPAEFMPAKLKLSRSLFLKKYLHTVKLISSLKLDHVSQHLFNPNVNLPPNQSTKISEMIVVTLDNSTQIHSYEQLRYKLGKHPKYFYSYIVSICNLIEQLQSVGLFCARLKDCLELGYIVREAERFKLDNLTNIYAFTNIESPPSLRKSQQYKKLVKKTKQIEKRILKSPKARLLIKEIFDKQYQVEQFLTSEHIFTEQLCKKRHFEDLCTIIQFITSKYEDVFEDNQSSQIQSHLNILKESNKYNAKSKRDIENTFFGSSVQTFQPTNEKSNQYSQK